MIQNGTDLDQVLAAAVERDILRPEQATALTALAAELSATEPSAVDPTPPATAPDEEKLRFISGFNDIFVGIGVCLFLGAVTLLFGEHTDRIVTSVVVAGASWGLAELFTRRRRMALPSIQLLSIFALSVFLALLWSIAALVGTEPSLDALEDAMLPFAPLARETPFITIAASLLTCAAVALHYLRFRVPVTVAAGAGALVLAGVAGVFLLAPGWAAEHVTGLLLASGLLVFALAMFFDLGDLDRTSHRTDIAFYLHLLAAMLVIHPILTVVTGGLSLNRLDSDGAVMILATLAALTLVALVIDRRAILGTGLIYAGFAFYTLIETADFSSSATSLSILALGAYILLISALWRPFRNSLLRLLPGNLARRLPRPAVSRA